MKFLQAVAQDIRKKNPGSDLSHLTIVLPGQRAALFFNEFLLQDKNETLWAPRYITISDLFASLSPLRKAETEESIFLLYVIYKQITKTNETLDYFYGWGERMLADFDDIDKNMANADKVFSMSSDLNELNTQISDLPDEDQTAIRTFFGQFFKRRTTCQEEGIQQRFFDLWQHLAEIYHQLNKNLLDSNAAYEGAFYRKTVEMLKTGEIELPNDTQYAFVGFNVLDKVEKSLFKLLKERDKAWFYWDYDDFYLEDDEAGIFVKENSKIFGNELPPEFFHTNWTEKEINIVETPGENAAAYNVSKWINLSTKTPLRETAIVLADENMLEPVLYAIPNEITDVNITKGYPIAHTIPYKEVEEFFRTTKKENACEHTFHDWVYTLKELDNIITERAREVHTDFQKILESDSDSALPITQHQRVLGDEAFFTVHTLITRLAKTFMHFAKLPMTSHMKFNFATLRRVVLQILRSHSVPLKGEPVVGLQIMGLLETRNLDFNNVILLSAGEGKLPKKEQDLSFIPYIIRKLYHLTLPSKKTAVYAYYFYRLLQRAQHITICYNGSLYDGDMGEPSRFILRLTNNDKLSKRIIYKKLSEKLQPRSLNFIKQIKTKSSIPLRKTYSPSALNSFLNCPMRYFLEKEANYSTTDTVDNFDHRLFGLFFHTVAEKLMNELGTQKILKPELLKECIDKIKNHNYLSKFFEEAYREVQKANNQHAIEANRIVEETVKIFIINMLKFDANLTDLRIEELEGKFTFPLTLENNKQINIGGYIDRLDSILYQNTRTIRVLDYKTGRKKNTTQPQDISELFTLEKGRNGYYLQTLLYSCAITDLFPHQKVMPALLYLPNLSQKDYEAELYFNKQSAPITLEEPGDELKKAIQQELLKVFKQLGTNKFSAKNTDENICKYCAFTEFCKPQN